jgi:hypothetical protein
MSGMKFLSEPQDKVMYLALQDFYPVVTPSMEFVSNIFHAFDNDSDDHALDTWATRLERWLPHNIGLLRDPADVNWNTFRIVDEKLYSFALLKYT